MNLWLQYLNILQTVDQFFEMSLLLDITHLQALLSIIFHCLDAYLVKVVSQLGKDLLRSAQHVLFDSFVHVHWHLLVYLLITNLYTISQIEVLAPIF